MQIVNQPTRTDGVDQPRGYQQRSNQSLTSTSKIGPINESLTQNKAAFSDNKNGANKKKVQGYHMLSNNNSMVIRNSNSQQALAVQNNNN